MHAYKEYRDLLQKVVAQAEKMVARLPENELREGFEILRFLQKFGCVGFPTGNAGEFGIGQWITRDSCPKSQQEALIVTACFSDDLTPSTKTDRIRGGILIHAEQAIFLLNVNHWSISELALNQGTPTFETTVANPASPQSCQISLGTKTFNDTPGTYTYQLLRITDAGGLQSNNGTVTVTVANTLPPTPTPTPCVGACPTVTLNPATPTPSFDSGGFKETR